MRKFVHSWMEDDVACFEIMPTFCVEELRNARKTQLWIADRLMNEEM